MYDFGGGAGLLKHINIYCLIILYPLAERALY